MAAHPDFARDELILLLDAYLDRAAGRARSIDSLCDDLRALPANAGHDDDPTFRNANGVGTAIRRFHEIAEGSLPDRYRPHYREVWEQFQADPTALKDAVAAVLANVGPTGLTGSTNRVFGNVAGIAEQTVFASRRELHDTGIHRPLQAGISGSAAAGADSIVVSGGYEDDVDYGNEIIYTGQGGNDPGSGRQIADQELIRGNLALARSSETGLPIRVVRGADGDPTYSPGSGYPLRRRVLCR